MMPEFVEWESFYVIVGAAAGALIGLQFVVLTLIAERPPVRGAAEASAAFVTPTIVHFSTALLLSALVRVPWQGIIPAAVLWGLTGLGGLAYTVMVARLMRRQAAYKPQFEDWLFHVLLPIAAYGILIGSAIAAPSHTHEALLGVLEQRRCCCFSSAFTTPGTALPTMYLSRGGKRRPSRARVKNRQKKNHDIPQA